MDHRDTVLKIEILKRLRDEILTARLSNGGYIRDVADVREWLEEKIEKLMAAKGQAAS